MGRHSVGAAAQRSQKWIQRVVNEAQTPLGDAIRERFGWPYSESIEWVSPLASDNYAEYSDEDVLARLKLSDLRVPLTDFWPTGGPHWDALARTGSGRVILVEAKAHIAELLSGPSGAGEASLSRIQKSLLDVKNALGSTSKADWSAAFYQTANRLAHLYFLRELNGIDAYLLYVCFVNASDVPKPATEGEWHGALQLVDLFLGVGSHRLKEFKGDVFVNPQDWLHDMP